MSDWIPTGLAKAIEEANRAAYERGLRRGLAIARENEESWTVDWPAARAQMEREIEEAKR